MFETEEYLFFYGGFCSQWLHSPFVDSDSLLCFNTAEQWMMYKKAKFFNDNATASRIKEAEHPKLQKQLGRSVKNFNDKQWDRVKENVVLRGNIMKFTQNPELRQLLLNTKDKTIVEASPTDVVWGIGLGLDSPYLLDERKWRGENLLGNILMEVRGVLQRFDAKFIAAELNELPLVKKGYL